MSQLVRLGPVKQVFCPICKMVASQLCPHIKEKLITTETRNNHHSERTPCPEDKYRASIKDEIIARKKINLTTPIVQSDGSIVFPKIQKVRDWISPYTRRFPVYRRTGNIFGRLERNFKDDRVYKEGSFTPVKDKIKASKSVKARETIVGGALGKTLKYTAVVNKAIKAESALKKSKTTKTMGKTSEVTTTLSKATKLRAALGKAPDASTTLGKATKITVALGKAPDASTTLGEATKITAALGKAPYVRTTLGEATKIAATLGKAADVSTTLGKATKIAAALGKAPDDMAALGEATEVTDKIPDVFFFFKFPDVPIFIGMESTKKSSDKVQAARTWTITIQEGTQPVVMSTHSEPETS